MKLHTIVLCLLFSLIGTLASLGATGAHAQDSTTCESSVTVESGSTLSAIANQYLGSFGAYQAIVDATNAAAQSDASYATIENASLIRVGWKLCIPAGGTALQSTATVAPEVAPEVTAQAESTQEEAAQVESTVSPSSATETPASTQTNNQTDPTQLVVDAPTPPLLDPSEELHPLMIESMRQQSYPGSELIIEQTLTPGANYSRYVASYQSEGNKIFGLLTVPTGQVPESGWPVILFNHGYIPPEIYRTAERYVAYQAAFARNGYISFKSDYRGHGSSEGVIDPDGPNSGNRHTAYTTDVLNALASLKLRPDVDAERIGMWGHSMGGQITLRAMVVSREIKAGSLWAGTVADYPTMWDQWEERARYSADWGRRMRQWREELVGTYGTAEENPTFWAAISPNSYLTDLSGPILLQHATGDASVPVEYSDILNAEIEAVGGDVEYFRYEGDDHNLSANLGLALTRDIEFFDAYLK